MSQKSILSFFAKADDSSQNKCIKSKDDRKLTPKKVSSPSRTSIESSKPNGLDKKEGSTAGVSNTSKIQNGNKQIDDESPVKQTRKRKAKTIIESDEESNQSQNEASSTKAQNSLEKMDVDSDSEAKENCNKSNENALSPGKLKNQPVLKKRKNNNDIESSLSNSSKKIKLEEECNEDRNISSVESSSSDRMLDLPVPPKRKTARKSISSKKQVPESTSDSEGDKNSKTDSLFPKVKTYERKNRKKESKNAENSPKESSEDAEIYEKADKTENKTADIESEESESVETKNASPTKSNSIHPFFAQASRKDKSFTDDTSGKKDVKDSKDNGKKAKSVDTVKKDKNTSDNESKSSPSNKAKKKADKKSRNSKSGNEAEKESSPSKNGVEIKKKTEINSVEVEKPEGNIQSAEEDHSSSGSDSSPTLKKNKKKSDDKNKSQKSKTKEENIDSSEEKKKISTSSTSSGILYDPSKNKYHPIEDACWKHGENVPYLALAKTLELIENTSGRLKIVEILSNYFRSVIVLTREDLLQSLYLCLNRIAPEYEGIELGVGDMVLMKAVAQATGRTLDKIRAEVKEKGDLGLVAESSRGNQKVMFAPPKLTVVSVFAKFKEIAKMSGNAAMAKKADKIQALFVACRDCEAKYIIRSLSGKLRIGLAEQSVLSALGRAVVMTPPSQSYPPEIIDKSSEMSSEKFKKLQDEKTLILKTTYCECPNYDLVVPVLLKEGIDNLPEHCQLSPGCPLKPMLAHPTNGVDEVLRRFDNCEFTCEYKYDGERAQIHRTEKGEIKIFSRNQEDNTSKYPDIIARITKALKDDTKSFILDSEVVAWDCEADEKQILPFQVLSTRKKKDAVESEIKVSVCVMAFDLLYLNGESLVKKPLKERRTLLHSSFVEIPNEFGFVNHEDGNSAETMQEFLDQSVKDNCEGLMVKALEVDASYEIAKRSHNWLKLKKDYLDGVGDTLDLVVIGGYHGKGKRTGTYGNFLLACYDYDNEEFQSICKIGTGFKDHELEAHTKFLKNHVIGAPKPYYRFDHSLEPDEWFEPEQIWEIKCADLSISPIHKAAMGIVDPEKGISLRFPRFIRIREDKKAEQATNSSQIAKMYQNQAQVQNMKAKPMNEEDYY